jgi:hypothetical protein
MRMANCRAVFRTLAVVAAALCVPATLSAREMPSVEQVRAENNLERRADKAWKFAADRLKDAAKAHSEGHWDQTRAAVDLMIEAVELGHQALEQTGKDPRKRFKHFKRGEVQTQALQKQLGELMRTMGYEEEEELRPVAKRLEEVHEALLHSVMGLRN